ncbi:MAG: ribose-5-phosphate isomerase RpiA [Candidatus Bipolaricaulia bacterium]
MPEEDLNREKLKRIAVEGAMDWIETNYDLSRELRIGVGSGSTVGYSFPKFSEYSNITAVPSSIKTRDKLVELGVEVDELEDSDQLVFDLDGADEVDPRLNLIKGGGGCHYLEKKVAKKSDSLFIVVDQTKLVDYLGQTFPLPVEVSPKSMDSTRNTLTQYGEPSFRRSGESLFWTDNGNVIVDVKLTERFEVEELKKLEKEINRIDGVIENGFFVDRKADIVFVGTEDGLKVIGDENK